MNRWLTWTATGALALLAAAASAAAADVQIDASRTGADGTTITGTWPNACTPVVSGRSGNDVLLGSANGLCGPESHAFSLTLPAPLPFSPVPPKDRLQPLHIYAAATPDAKAQLVGFRLLGGRDTPSHPDAGFWWPVDTRSSNGSVLGIELQQDALGVSLMSYDDASGAPVWYFGTGQLHGSVAHVELLRMDRGSSPFAESQTAPQAQPSMSIDLAFSSDTSARAWLSRSDVGGGIDLVAMDIARVPFSPLPQQQSWLGSWLVAASAAPDGQLALPDTLVWTRSDATDAGHMRLADASGDYALDCLHAANDETAPAQRCVLRDASGAIVVTFAHVGFDRLDGHTIDGRPVALIRPR
ncbi:MAG TPA: hypothetical protein VFG73_04040 [Rhodanobacteraceae bacterium]|nr:hypothetical protein [Rhodanobacteraceae bacterium]